MVKIHKFCEKILLDREQILSKYQSHVMHRGLQVQVNFKMLN